ncbi:isocitrate lyase/PEP mutase family protein [Kribbella endophytica]
MTDLAAKASELLRLHHTGTTLVLPTVWDAWSARTVAAAGFPALSIGSHPLADSRGQKDNEGMSLDDALDGVRRITSAVDVPVTADLESGYNTPAAELVERTLEAGAAGINIEDTVHSESRLRALTEHADYIAALRAAADAANVDLVINARTDALITKLETFEDPLTEAVNRSKACESAGARCVYPVGIPSPDALKTFLSELSGPLNVTADPVKGAYSGTYPELQAAGVHRITFGPLLQFALTEKVTDLLSTWH